MNSVDARQLGFISMIFGAVLIIGSYIQYQEIVQLFGGMFMGIGTILISKSLAIRMDEYITSRNKGHGDLK